MSISDRPRAENGLPIPWVALWDSEKPALRTIRVRAGARGRHLIYDHESPSDRDEHGVLWMPDGLSQTGTPLFAQVNTHRQRLCQQQGKCQVCGRRMRTGMVTYLLPRSFVSQDRVDTMIVPTCRSCAKPAAKLCPHLRDSDYVLASVIATHSGYWGDLAVATPAGLVWHKQIMLALGDGRLDMFLAKQLVVNLRIKKWEDIA